MSHGEQSPNLVIEGDNLQVMVSLQSQYNDTVDVVYIDPPYNRGGNDFRYSDARYKDPDADASDAVYITNEDGGRHTKWLNYMAPRLVTIQRLMADHGVVFVSINDIELGRLLMLMDEVFDESNRIGVIAWKGSADNNPSRIAIEHEYIVCYAKSIKKVAKQWTTPNDDVRDALLEQYDAICLETDIYVERKKRWAQLVKANKEAVGRLGNYTELDPVKGPYQSARRVHNPKPGGYRYGVCEDGVVSASDPRAYAMPLNGYRFKPETMERHIQEGRIVFPKNRGQIVQMKDFLVDYRGSLRSVIELDARAGAYRLKNLFGKDFDGFRNAKPVELIEMLVGAAGGKDALVLDCFAGSGTTGEAVLQLNKRDGGSRKFLLIEEGNGEDLYARTLVVPRLRRAIEVDGLPGGFTFLATGKQLDRKAILGLERDKIAALICQTDRSGVRTGIRAISGKQWVIGANQRGEALALVWQGPTNSRVDVESINAAIAEAREIGLSAKLQIYGTTCTVSETSAFTFKQIPDEILLNLNLEDPEEDDDVVSLYGT
ncbi:site-specific DNA-methyltransferase [Streptomyces sp. GbtcB7]|uniref:site-specific DNA-methyltransferase n=1 Tax=Streptomyces sp. GbtcB7 TaxID=2824752 RepID=UPI001C2F95CA|nr:site-specific DNA-methyltransferase [Streptomyces sp. GbtcB7]